MLSPEQSNDFFDTAFDATAGMAILRGYGPDRARELSANAFSMALTLIEIPLQGDEATRALSAVASESPGVIGAGTITSVELVDQAADLGATYTVAPGFDEAVAIRSLERGLAHLPGVATASEIQRAMSAGFRWLKAFPAARLGAAWFSAMREPFPGVRLVATGGITPENYRSMIDAGAAAVSFGASFESLPPDSFSRT